MFIDYFFGIQGIVPVQMITEMFKMWFLALGNCILTAGDKETNTSANLVRATVKMYLQLSDIGNSNNSLIMEKSRQATGKTKNSKKKETTARGLED